MSDKLRLSQIDDITSRLMQTMKAHPKDALVSELAKDIAAATLEIERLRYIMVRVEALLLRGNYEEASAMLALERKEGIDMQRYSDD